jgi:hypothetical protein
LIATVFRTIAAIVSIISTASTSPLRGAPDLAMVSSAFSTSRFDHSKNVNSF